MSPLRVLVVEDDPDDVLLCHAAIKKIPGLQYQLSSVGSLHEAVDHLAAHGADVSLVDLSLPDAQGLDAITVLARQFEELPLVVLTGLRDEAAAARALQAGAQDYLVKDTGDRETIGRAMRYAIERKHAEQARAAKDAAEAANGAKTAFLSSMSHELRTPLNAMLGFAQLLEMDDLAQDQREAVAHIGRAGRHLLALITEVLDVARVESGELSLSMETVSVADVVDETVQMVRPLAAQREITIARAGDDALYVHADRQRMSQVLLNLLSNAVKYNRPHGRVDVRWERPDDGPVVLVEVGDTGSGFSPEDLPRVFAPFDRLGAETTGVEGTGIGLALSLRLAEAMGGALSVESTPQVGSAFTLQLDVSAAPTLGVHRAVAAPTTTDPAVRPHVLVSVEDNPANIELMARIVALRPSWTLVHTATGGAAHDLVLQQRPDLVFLDLHLPDVTGADVLRILREDPRTAAVPVWMVTAEAAPSQRRRLRELGADGYVAKPFDIAEVLGVLDAAATRPRPDVRT